MNEILIIVNVCLALVFLFFLYKKKKEIQHIHQTYSALKNENKILLQQLSVIREDKAYQGVHLREVQQAFDDLDKSILKLRAVCKIKSHEMERKLDKWQGTIPIDDGPDLGKPQIKISFSSGQGINENHVRKIFGKK